MAKMYFTLHPLHKEPIREILDQKNNQRPVVTAHNKTIPSVFGLHDVLFDDRVCKGYLLQKDLFYREMSCPIFSRLMERYISHWCFRCPTKSCRRELTLSKKPF
jgi:hypothetical protein